MSNQDGSGSSNNGNNQEENRKLESEEEVKLHQTSVSGLNVNYLNLEQDGINKVQELLQTNNVNENTLMHIINSGNDMFKHANGRNMTYSEMRELYG